MIPRHALPTRLATILTILDQRGGASVAYLQQSATSTKTGTTMTAPALRAAIGRLRAAGYDITFGAKSACDGRGLYTWVRSAVAPRPVGGDSLATY